ncbi:MAG: hypothetical protein WCJ93_12025 [Methanomicrobiales archaeon]
MKTQQEQHGEHILVFKVYQWVAGIKGSPYRVLAIPEEFTLYQFAEFITDSVDFDFDHSFGFYNHLIRYIDATEAYELFFDDPNTRSECPSFVKGVKKTPVNTVFTEIGKMMLFFFDYGNNWKFRVELLCIEPTIRGKSDPECIQSVKKARSQYDDWEGD